MRQQLLHGFVLHQRAYRENSKLVQLFSLEFGRVDGVLRQSQIPLYQPALLYATGKSALKTFTKLEWVGQPKQLKGNALFAGFYANELLVRLSPTEEPLPQAFAGYSQLLDTLETLPDHDPQHLQLMQALRRFESVLLAELGYAINFSQDSLGLAILADQYYSFEASEGFRVHTSGELGEHLLAVGVTNQFEAQSAYAAPVVAMLTRVHRKVLTTLLGNKPLKSRELWIGQSGQSTE